MAGGRSNRGQYGGGNEIRSKDVAGGRKDRVLYDGRNV